MRVTIPSPPLFQVGFHLGLCFEFRAEYNLVWQVQHNAPHGACRTAQGPSNTTSPQWKPPLNSSSSPGEGPVPRGEVPAPSRDPFSPFRNQRLIPLIPVYEGAMYGKNGVPRHPSSSSLDIQRTEHRVLVLNSYVPPCDPAWVGAYLSLP